MEYFIDDVWGEDTLKRRLGSKNDLDEFASSAPLYEESDLLISKALSESVLDYVLVMSTKVALRRIACALSRYNTTF